MAEQVESKNRATSSEEARAAVLAKCKTEGVESCCSGSPTSRGT